MRSFVVPTRGLSCAPRLSFVKAWEGSIVEDIDIVEASEPPSVRWGGVGSNGLGGRDDFRFFAAGRLGLACGRDGAEFCGRRCVESGSRITIPSEGESEARGAGLEGFEFG